MEQIDRIDPFLAERRAGPSFGSARSPAGDPNGRSEDWRRTCAVAALAVMAVGASCGSAAERRSAPDGEDHRANQSDPSAELLRRLRAEGAISALLWRPGAAVVPEGAGWQAWIATAVHGSEIVRVRLTEDGGALGPSGTETIEGQLPYATRWQPMDSQGTAWVGLQWQRDPETEAVAIEAWRFDDQAVAPLGSLPVPDDSASWWSFDAAFPCYSSGLLVELLVQCRRFLNAEPGVAPRLVETELRVLAIRDGMAQEVERPVSWPLSASSAGEDFGADWELLSVESVVGPQEELQASALLRGENRLWQARSDASGLTLEPVDPAVLLTVAQLAQDWEDLIWRVVWGAGPADQALHWIEGLNQQRPAGGAFLSGTGVLLSEFDCESPLADWTLHSDWHVDGDGRMIGVARCPFRTDRGLVVIDGGAVHPLGFATPPRTLDSGHGASLWIRPRGAGAWTVLCSGLMVDGSQDLALVECLELTEAGGRWQLRQLWQVEGRELGPKR
jgi:hypothetical protein